MQPVSLRFVSILFLLVIIITASESSNGAQKHIRIIQQIIPTCYGVMFDAGSSGTRVYVYNWPCRQNQTILNINIVQNETSQKVKPGLGAQAGNISNVQAYLAPLIKFAKANIPQGVWNTTPILMGCTAGMRIIPLQAQTDIMIQVRQVLTNSGFLFLYPEWARVITGNEEGAYLWLTVNYLLTQINTIQPETNTSIAIDLGGASTQIGYQPLRNPKVRDNEISLNIPNFNQYDIYSTSYLGYGNDLARISVVSQQVITGQNIVYSPCFSKDYTAQWEGDKTKIVVGTGKFLKCQNLVKKFLNNTNQGCHYPFKQCGINQFFQPSMVPGMKIYGVSAINNAADFLGVQQFTLPQFLKLAKAFCALSWGQVQNITQYKNNPYTATDFFLVIYVYELLNTGYRIPQNVTIYSPDAIQGNAPGWTLAAMFYQVAQIKCQYDSPLCSMKGY